MMFTTATQNHFFAICTTKRRQTVVGRQNFKAYHLRLLIRDLTQPSVLEHALRSNPRPWH